MFTYNKQISLRLNSLIFLLLVTGILVAVARHPASALTIIREYIPPGESFEFDGFQITAGKPPATLVGNGSIIEVFDAAANSWENAIGDDHTVTIQFGWSPLPIGAGIHNVRSQGGSPNRITEAVVYFDNDGSTVWFLDSTPGEHSEYSIAVTCYADLGTGRLNSGRILSKKMNAVQALDFLTIAKHEIGHALGLSTWNYEWEVKNAEEGIQITKPRPFAESVIPTDSGGHLRLHGALMDQVLLPRQRKLMSVADVLAIAEMGEFTDLNLTPEEYSSHNSLKGKSGQDSTCPPNP